MKWITFEKEGKWAIGVLTEKEEGVIPADTFLEKEIADMQALIEAYPDGLGEAEKAALKNAQDKAISLEKVSVKAPIPRTKHDVICVGVNYMAHVAESTAGLKDEALAKPPEKPIFFSKRVVEMTGPESPVVNNWEVDSHLDYEAELAVVIGRRGKNIPKEQVENHIFGYSVFNDVSARITQEERNQWFMGKSLDTYSCMGPAILTRQALPFPLEVDVISRINGEERQHGNTRQLLRDVPTLVSEISRYFTLEPGDILITGTPSGVAMGMETPKWLVPGDVMECEIPEIGILRNPVK